MESRLATYEARLRGGGAWRNMAAMSERLPEGLFREQVEHGSPEPPEEKTPGSTTKPASRILPRLSRGVAPRVVVAGVLGALLLGFGAGRLVALTTQERPGTSPSASPSAIATSHTSATGGPDSTSEPTMVPYSGQIASLAALDATGECDAGPTSNGPVNLIDKNPDTIWRCPGKGKDERIRFTLDPTAPVVGARVVNGNTVWQDRYLEERRIICIRWTFSDGSYVLQGLSANDQKPQEVRFPPVTGADWVELSIEEVTSPGTSDTESDAVSISSLSLLTPG